MKKYIKIVIALFLAAFFVLLFVQTVKVHRQGYSSFQREFEFLSYLYWCDLLLMGFWWFFGKTSAMKIKLLGAVLTSILFTVAVFFANNFWRYLDINADFREEIPYGYFLIWDITYTNGYGELRYPLVFAAMLLLCGAAIFFSLPKVKGFVRRRSGDLFWWCYYRIWEMENLDSLYGAFCENADRDRLSDYVSRMPLNQKNKEKMMRYAEEKEECFLIHLLLQRYGEMITKEEFDRLKQLYAEWQEDYIQRGREYFAKAEVTFSPAFERQERRFRETDET